MNTCNTAEMQPHATEQVVIQERFHNSSKVIPKHLAAINHINQKLISTQSNHQFLGPAQKLTYGRFLLNKDKK